MMFPGFQTHRDEIKMRGRNMNERDLAFRDEWAPWVKLQRQGFCHSSSGARNSAWSHARSATCMGSDCHPGNGAGWSRMYFSPGTVDRSVKDRGAPNKVRSGEAPTTPKPIPEPEPVPPRPENEDVMETG